MKKLAFILGFAMVIFVSAQIADATQVIDDALHVNSLKVGQQGSGGVTYFNGTIINETTTNGVDNPVAFGDNVRIDGRVYRGATAGTGDSQPFIVNDNMEVVGSLTVGSTNVGTQLSSLQSQITTLESADSSLQTQIDAKGVGDMLRAVYDVGNNGLIDNDKIDAGMSASLIGSGIVTSIMYDYLFDLNLNDTNNIHLTALGVDAGDSVESTGFYNTFIGWNAGDATTTGDSNTAVGSGVMGVLGANSTGSSNTAIGTDALAANTTGSDNTAIGARAMVATNGTSTRNVAIGGSAFDANLNGVWNTVVGWGALGNGTGVDGSVALGYLALSGASGDNNIAIGYQAGNNITSGSNNIIIGHDIDAAGGSGATNELNIGNALIGNLSTGALTFNEVKSVTADINDETLTVGASGSVWTNRGDTDGTTFTLPEASVALGSFYTFATLAAQTLYIDPADTSDQILGLTNAAGDRISNGTIGDTVTLMAVDDDSWVEISSRGTWADAN